MLEESLDKLYKDHPELFVNAPQRNIIDILNEYVKIYVDVLDSCSPFNVIESLDRYRIYTFMYPAIQCIKQPHNIVCVDSIDEITYECADMPKEI